MTLGYGQKCGVKTCILFSDESALTNECERRQNQYPHLCHESPRTIHKLPAHALNIDVWCAVSMRKVIRPGIFRKNNFWPQSNQLWPIYCDWGAVCKRSTRWSWTSGWQQSWIPKCIPLVVL